MESRPRPVVAAMSVLAGLQAATATAGFTDAVPEQVALWIIIGIAAAQGAIQFWVQNQVTPVADPHTADGTPLVPAPVPVEGGGDVTTIGGV